MSYGTTKIANNTAANGNGGALSLHQSDLDIKGICDIFNNHAVNGGGIHATSSTIALYQPGYLQFRNNFAKNGGGIYLKGNSKLYLLKNQRVIVYYMKFISNHGEQGGAVYVADNTNFSTCLPDVECFIQSLALYSISDKSCADTEKHILFSGNTATSIQHGHTIFGGLLDRCVPSPLAIVNTGFSGVGYLQCISNISALDTIASQPVRLCFCSTMDQPDCRYQPPSIKVQKGEAFTVSLVAVDQVNCTVDANIFSTLSSFDGGFKEGQQTQRVQRMCTALTFQVLSPHDSEVLTLYAEGPCGNARLSTRNVTIEFENCTCPVGFEPSNTSKTTCECKCDSILDPYITKCNSTNSSLFRVNTNSWINYIDNTYRSGYVIHPNCPFDFCKPSTENMSSLISTNLMEQMHSVLTIAQVYCVECVNKTSVSPWVVLAVCFVKATGLEFLLLL